MNSRRTFLIATPLLLMTSGAYGLATETHQAQQPDGIYIVGALHRLHATEPDFDFAALRRVIETINPDVMVLEVRPDELDERKDTPGRPEYPQVVWPLLRQRTVQTVAMEPGGALFTEMVNAASAAMNAFRQRDSASAAFWSSYQSSFTTALQAHWRGPADAHDKVTADLSRSFELTQSTLAGSGYDRIQERWSGYMVERAVEAVRAHPRARILVLASYRNRHHFDAALRAAAPSRVVAMDEWLRANVRQPSSND
jgi:hypothetical protein